MPIEQRELLSCKTIELVGNCFACAASTHPIGRATWHRGAGQVLQMAARQDDPTSPTERRSG
jgi:hypothetical protein